MNRVAHAPHPGPTYTPARFPAATSPAPAGLPLRIRTGPWPSGHVQGVAVDQDRGFVYFSFTTMLVKTDLSGTVIGSVTGLTGHLGDIDFNPDDGRVYGSLEYKAQASFYIAVFDVDRMVRSDMHAETDGVVSTVYLKEVADDFTAALPGSGTSTGPGRPVLKHRYGCSGIDGISFGPTPGAPRGPRRLMVAYGIYADTSRTDNDHQVLLQYDTTQWKNYEKPLLQEQPHTSGPPEPANKFFVFTGNTRFGVQNLKYDPSTGNWLMGVYTGSKDGFPNYSLFLVDGSRAPLEAPLEGCAGERAQLLQLHRSGLYDAGSGVHGWSFRADVGLEALGDGYFYVSEQGTASGADSTGQTSTLRLHRWTGEAPAPLTAVHPSPRVFPASPLRELVGAGAE